MIAVRREGAEGVEGDEIGLAGVDDFANGGGRGVLVEGEPAADYNTEGFFGEGGAWVGDGAAGEKRGDPVVYEPSTVFLSEIENAEGSWEGEPGTIPNRGVTEGAVDERAEEEEGFARAGETMPERDFFCGNQFSDKRGGGSRGDARVEFFGRLVELGSGPAGGEERADARGHLVDEARRDWGGGRRTREIRGVDAEFVWNRVARRLVVVVLVRGRRGEVGFVVVVWERGHFAGKPP